MGKFGVCPTEIPVVRSMDQCAPKFAEKVANVLVKMKAKGHDPYVFESTRTQDRVSYLYGFGRRYDDGRGVVTKCASVTDTWHGFGLAVDIISYSKEWDAPAQFWADLRVFATEEGLCSGDDWDRDNVPGENDPDEHFHDKPHIQWWCTGMHVRPSAHAAQLLREQGASAVWQEVHAL